MGRTRYRKGGRGRTSSLLSQRWLPIHIPGPRTYHNEPTFILAANQALVNPRVLISIGSGPGQAHTRYICGSVHSRAFTRHYIFHTPKFHDIFHKLFRQKEEQGRRLRCIRETSSGTTASCVRTDGCDAFHHEGRPSTILRSGCRCRSCGPNGYMFQTLHGREQKVRVRPQHSLCL